MSEHKADGRVGEQDSRSESPIGERAAPAFAAALDRVIDLARMGEQRHEERAELIAIIHQSVDDAHEAWGVTMAELDALRADNERLREACELGLGFVEAHAGHMPQSRLALIGRMRRALDGKP